MRRPPDPVSSGVVALALVAQASRFGLAFFIFAFAILPVLFFLGMVTYGRLLQTSVEDVIYARAISRIRAYYRQIDPSEAAYFAEESLDFVGLRAAGLFGLGWQQFLTAAAMVAIVNSVVGGVLIGLLVGYFFAAAVLLRRCRWAGSNRLRCRLSDPSAQGVAPDWRIADGHRFPSRTVLS